MSFSEDVLKQMKDDPASPNSISNYVTHLAQNLSRSIHEIILDEASKTIKGSYPFIYKGWFECKIQNGSITDTPIPLIAVERNVSSGKHNREITSLSYSLSPAGYQLKEDLSAFVRPDKITIGDFYLGFENWTSEDNMSYPQHHEVSFQFVRFVPFTENSRGLSVRKLDFPVVLTKEYKPKGFISDSAVFWYLNGKLVENYGFHLIIPFSFSI